MCRVARLAVLKWLIRKVSSPLPCVHLADLMLRSVRVLDESDYGGYSSGDPCSLDFWIRSRAVSWWRDTGVTVGRRTGVTSTTFEV